MRRFLPALLTPLLLTACHSTPTTPPTPVTAADYAKLPEPCMDWWRDARFGMFIHWGLYSIPAGQWDGHTNYGEWLLSEAHIPVEQYEHFKDQFNPTKFNADAWAAAAKGAGMKYIVITTKHHDGFCLFDSKFTDYDVMSTPFKRDIMKEMADATRKQGLTMGFYHSIMDWHHPDYLPRREWETRPTTGADFNRYNQHLKDQVGEILRNYGPIGVIWFDGQWEGTWTHERGLDLAAYVRSISPNTIMNNRVDKGGGSFGMTRSSEYAGDFGTPEQEIPPTGFPGVDWETCMTMNRHWGYNAADKDFKSTEDLIRKLADIASKGGNFLLNVGPTGEGEIPPESLQRLHEIGNWMNVYGESIYATQAGPFAPTWGRITQKDIGPAKSAAGSTTGAITDVPVTRLYLHVFNWPRDGQLVLPQVYNDARSAFLLGDREHSIPVTRSGDDLIVQLPLERPDDIDTVVALDINGAPDIGLPPEITTDSGIFVDAATVGIASPRHDIQLHYTVDEREPTAASPVAPSSEVSGWRPLVIERTTTLKARAFRGTRPVSPTSTRTITKVTPAPALKVEATRPGVHFEYYEGDWKKLPNFNTPTSSGRALTPKNEGYVTSFDRQPRTSETHFGFRYTGYYNAPATGIYTFALGSDDGSNLYLDGGKLIDNDGLHSLEEKSAPTALAAGLHEITIDFFEASGGHELQLHVTEPGGKRREVKAAELATR